MIRKRDRYRFLLKCGDVEHVATPIYNGLKKVWEQESGEIFFREKLEGTLKFVGKDYAFVRGCDFAKQIDVEIYKTTDDGQQTTEELYWKGYFRKTDCETDINHGMISVKPKPNDKYKLMMDKLSEEYNLVKHNPKMSDVSMTVRPMLQVYELGADYVNNIIGSNSYKQTVSPIYDLTNYGYMHFGIEQLACANIRQNLTGLDLGEAYLGSGDWTQDPNQSNTYYFGLSDRDMYMNRPYRIMMKLLSDDQHIYIYMEEYTDSNGWQTKYTYKNPETYQQWITRTELSTLSKLKLYTLDDGNNATLNLAVEFDFNFVQVNARLLTRGFYEPNISEEDTFVQSEIYDNVSRINLTNRLTISNATSEEITQWGTVENEEGIYYVPTTIEENISQYEPIAQDLWRGYISFWIKIYDLSVEFENRYSKTKTLKDWYSLYEVIRVLLKAIDPNVTVSHGSASSMFLWGKTNPITGMENQGEMFLLQKSNATKLEYDYSATKAEITLKKIFDWLKTFNVYWDVVEYFDGRLVLRLEHKLFYMNGESYNSNNITNIDLRNIYDTRNGKDYAYLTNNWKYEDVNNVATKIYYKWMDEVSLPFEGEALTAVDNPYGEEHQETRTAEAFTSDIDYIFANSETVSKDGFVVVQGYKGEGERAYKIHFYDTTINGRQYHLQNGLLSVAYMQRYYMPYDMPSRQMTITGGDVIDVVRTKQLRQNEVKFALPKGMEINEYTTLTTEAGVGTILRMEQDLSTEIYTTTLKYDNEQ